MGIYQNETTREISFPIGGIGTGCIGLGGNGRLLDWEIFNRPSKGSTNGFSHFAVRAKQADGTVCARVLAGDQAKDLSGQYGAGFGFGSREYLSAMPHFRSCKFRGEFPVAELTFRDEMFPAEVKLTAFNPLIPLDAAASSIPAAFFTVTFCNPTDTALHCSAALSVQNPYPVELARNKQCTADSGTGVTLFSGVENPDAPEYGDMTILTDASDASVQKYWYFGEWRDQITTFWREFSSGAPLRDREYPGINADKADVVVAFSTAKVNASSLTATICAEAEVPAYGEANVRFVLSWSNPNVWNFWKPERDASGEPIQHCWKNHYATVFSDSAQSASYALRHFSELQNRTERFRKALFGGNLDPAVIDAASANLSILKSPTVLRLEDGTFYGFEGCGENTGSCEGSCTHVWNYAYALPFLFPELERSMREADYRYNLQPDGSMCFRLQLPLGRAPQQPVLPCLDGQMGGVFKVYREWKLCGDTEWLRKLWPSVRSSLEYAWQGDSIFGWDRDQDGVLEGRQHHTLDMELFGPSSWLEGFYLAALRAGAEMADELGNPDQAQKYRALFARGSQWMETHLFNGHYYQQEIDLRDHALLGRYHAPERYWNNEQQELKYQIGDGCEIDQMCAQWHADIIGLGDIFDPVHRAAALHSLWANNFVESFRDRVNFWRIFALNDESGAMICTYPKGAYRPAIPLPYETESMHGFEYQFAGLLMAEGMQENGLQLVRAVRERYDGQKRNPWNEIECGSNYARSMASYAFIPILSGFVFDLPHFSIGFRPRMQPLQTIWSVDSGWGTVDYNASGCTVEIAEGRLELEQFVLPADTHSAMLKIDGMDVPFREAGGQLTFAHTVIQNTLQVLF